MVVQVVADLPDQPAKGPWKNPITFGNFFAEEAAEVCLFVCYFICYLLIISGFQAQCCKAQC